MVKLVENAGFGFDKIDENWKAYNSTIPDYQIKLDSVVVGFQMEAEELKQKKPQQELEDWQQELQQELKDYIHQGLEEEQQESQQESLYGKILDILLSGALSTQEVSIALGQKSISGQLYSVINKLREGFLIEWTIPETPKSPNQKYKMTKKGLAFYMLVKK